LRYASSGLLSFHALESSRYLRFWPGKIDEAKALWETICGEDRDSCSLDQIVEFHGLLDTTASMVYNDMENERIQWQEEKLISDMLEKFFYTHSVENRLSFKNFIAWDVIAAELWYSDKDAKSVHDIWLKFSDKDSNTVGFKEFRKIYEYICKDNLNIK